MPSASDRGEKLTTTGIGPREAVRWFLCDVAQVSGYALTDIARPDRRSMYAMFRPLLTEPDPWYYSGSVALEAAKICDLFPAEESDALLREVFDQLDRVIGHKKKDVSNLTFLMMGRLGMGAVLMRRRVPDDLLGKIMMILIGSETAAAPLMPAPDAHRQLRAALKVGAPVWWSMFKKDYHIELGKAAAAA